LPYYQRSAR